MKKLWLDMDALRVESFDPAPAAGVRAHSGPVSNPEGGCVTLPTEGVSLCPDQCSNWDGCSLAGTCNYSCRSEPCVCVPQG